MNRNIYLVFTIAVLLIAPLRANGQVPKSDSCGVELLPWSEDFEGFEERILCWTFVDADGDGYGWTKEMNQLFEGHNSNSSIASASYIQGIGTLHPNNWLISPEIELPTGPDITLSWYEKSQDPSYIAEHYSVYISTSGSNLSDFSTQLFSHTINSSGWAQQSVSLNAYKGQRVRIAFRHHNSADHYWLVLDDIKIESEQAPTVECTVLSNDPEMGEVTGGGTYSLGEQAVLSAYPTEHHHFVAWNDGERANPRTLVLTQDTTMTALFGLDTLHIRVITNDIMRGHVTGSGDYAYGSMVEATATAYTGYSFSGWDNGIKASPYTFGAATDLTLMALFVPEDSVGIQKICEDDYQFSATNGQITIMNVQGKNVRIYDIRGRLIYRGCPIADSCKVSINTSGIYLIQIENGPMQRVIGIR